MFKKIGVVLVKQDKEDAKNNVKRRLEMIQGQINDVTKAMKKNDDEEERITKKILVCDCCTVLNESVLPGAR